MLHPHPPRPPGRGGYAAALAIIGALLTGACEEALSPIEAGRRFSVFGYLDASADTQWIRIMPVRPLLLTPAGSLDLTVAVEDVAGGAAVTLRDSTFQFLELNPVDGDPLRLHNFWTTTPIRPGGAYRLRIRESGAPDAEAVVKIPERYGLEVWIGQGFTSDPDVVAVSGVRDVAFVMRDLDLEDRCGPYSVRVFSRVPAVDGEDHQIPIAGHLPSRNNCGLPQIEQKELMIVGSGAPWPVGDAFEADALGVPDVPSNITHSVGFLGGVLTRRIPHEACVIETELPVDYCRLSYDPESAVLIGSLDDVSCGGGPVDGADVVLRELEWDPPGPRIRSTRSRAGGRFEIHALQAGRPYRLTVRKTTADPQSAHLDHVETLVFSAGERRTLEIPLPRAFGC